MHPGYPLHRFSTKRPESLHVLLTADVSDWADPAMERTAMLFNRQHDRTDRWCDALVITGREIEDRILIIVVYLLLL